MKIVCISNRNIPAGFTFMELLISIAIFVIITAMVIVNFRSGQYRDELLGGAEAIETALREMQTKTNSGETVKCPLQPEPSAPRDGYGVQITDAPPLIIAFADCSDDSSYKYTYNATDDLLLKTVLLPVNVAIEDSIPASPWNIVFSPFSEVVIVNTNYDITPVVQITLKHSRTEREITVKLNRLTGQTSYE
ncbi:MAG: prepilin-type N-terminal cleavage/methylation domain-containing protein [Patescibacteria group bacterium]